MVYQDQKQYTFVSQAYPENTFSVARFRGNEGISSLYEFDILLACDDPEIDTASVLQNPATFSIITPDAEFPIYGIMARFEQLHELDETIFYRGVLVPRLWQANLYHDNQLFLAKSVTDIIEEILAQANLTSNDYELRCTGTYSAWEYICQYRESDFNFFSRWMEREGIYYYFEQTEDGDRIMITDSSTSHRDVRGNAVLNYIPASGLVPEDEDAVRSLICRHQMLPRNVVLRDYNYRRPTLDLRGEADVDPSNGRGTVYIYGEHFKTPEEGNGLARIRAEELICRERVFHGESTAPNIRPGFLFDLAGHYRNSYNQQYLVTEVRHEGRQSRFLFPGEAPGSEESSGEMSYSNQFTAIPADVQYRPERKTTKPRFYGSMNATIDAAGDGQYAEIDDQGRYKVILPFDQSGNSGGRASRWVRMAQPYAGANFGMHFPLHKGTEVLLTFVDGDPDRPIIAGSVPNPDTMSPVTGNNQSQSVIRTGGGNQIRIEDSDGGQQIHLSSPTEGSIISLGAPNKGNIYFKTVGNMVTKVDGPEDRTVKGPVFVEHGDSYELKNTGKVKITYQNDVTTKTFGSTIEEFQGSKKSTMKGTTDEFYEGNKKSVCFADTDETFMGVKKSANLAATAELFVGVKQSTNLAATNENFVGIKTEACAALSISRSGVKTLFESPINEIEGKAAVKIKCGGSSIEMTPGSIKINSPSILISSSGGMVRMNGSVTVGGRTAFTDNVSMDENLKVNGKFSNPSIDANK